MFKYIKLAAIALLLSVGFTACNDDYYYEENSNNNNPSIGTDEVYALIQGNAFGGIGGSIDKLLVKEGVQSNVVKDFFTKVNEQELGNGPQEGIHYGSRIYVSVQASNILWVLDASTLKIQHKIQMNQPTALCATKGYVFVTNFDGNVTRVDTAHLDKTPKLLAVGPNPDGIAAHENKVYVTISDGLNYQGNYANGKKFIELNAEEFTKVKEYKTAVNPGQIVCNQYGEVYVVTRGNYADVTPMVQKLMPNGKVEDFEPGSFIAVDRDMLYIMDSQVDWSKPESTAHVTIKRFNMTDDTCEENFIKKEDLPANPTHIAVHPVTRDIYICSDKTASGYTLDGYVYRYNYGGELLNRYNVGVHPYDIIFK